MLTSAYRYSSNTVIRAMLILLCFCAAALSRWINLDIFVMLCAVLFGLMTFRCNLSFLLKYSTMIAGAALAIIGTYVIEENRLWLPELQKYSRYNGSLPLIVGYYLFFILSLELGDRHFSKERKPAVKLRIHTDTHDILQMFLDAFGIAFLCVTAFMCFRIARHPYFLIHMDRFAYKATYIRGVWGKIALYYIYFLPLLLMNWHRGRQRKLIVLTLTLYVAYLFLQGEKYGGYLTLTMFALFYFIPELSKGSKRKLFRIVVLVILIFIIAVATILLQYTLLYNNRALDQLYERVAQQGQLWWNIYGMSRDSVPHIKEIKDELNAYYSAPEGIQYYAIFKIMYLSAPENVVTNKISTGSSYTESTPASLYYYFGAAVLPFFALIMGFLFAYLAYAYRQSICNGYFIEAVIITRLFLVVQNLFGMSMFYKVFSVNTLITVIVWILCVLARNARKIEKRTFACEQGYSHRICSDGQA